MCYIDVRPLASFFMDNNIIFDIRNYIESKYPKLTLDEIDRYIDIAKTVVFNYKNWLGQKYKNY